ncbi:MAG: hypothetical protein JXB00_12615 [Bacteroidales bacterium]|nr:hypothetical protein [Bacteroidales bacterium]
METVGLIPAGGTGERLGKLPCSKEVFPVADNDGKISVISQRLIGYFKLGGIKDIYFIIRKGKWDIPQYFGDGSEQGVNIGYLIMNLPYGTPFTLNQAYPFIKDKTVALGFPDIIFQPEDAFKQVNLKLTQSKADIVLGLTATDQYQRSDMIEFNKDGSIKNIIIKQNRPDLRCSWFIAMWEPSFSAYMNHYLAKFLKKYPDGRYLADDGQLREPFVGDVIQNALKDGLNANYVLFKNGRYLDVGTKNEMANTLQGKTNI